MIAVLVVFVAARPGSAPLGPANPTQRPAVYPKLQKVSLGFQPREVSELDRVRLKEGFVILQGADGTPRYEVPIRFPAPTVGPTTRLREASLTPEYIDILCAVDAKEYTIRVNRPTGFVDCTLLPTDIDAYLEGDFEKENPESGLSRLVRSLPKEFLHQQVSKALTNEAWRILQRRREGEYLAPSDSQKEVDALKFRVLRALNESLSASNTYIPVDHWAWNIFQFERPLLHVRLLNKTAAGQSAAALDARRALGFLGIMGRLYPWGDRTNPRYRQLPYRGVWRERVVEVPPFPRWDVFVFHQIND